MEIFQNNPLLEIKNKNQQIENKIDYRFKIIYCIAMLSVISSHCNGKGSIELNIQGWMNYRSFHMPLFMFAAGYFFKKKNINNTIEYILRKFKKLILRIYLYNLFYGFYLQLLKVLFKINIRLFNARVIFIEPLGGRGFRNITPSWFSSSLFLVEFYNIIKRKLTFHFNIEINESIYFIIDFFLSYYSVIFSNKGYNKIQPFMDILRFIHLNIYYELGIFYKKYIESFIKKTRNVHYFIFIFTLKLLFHLYYSAEPGFYYGMSEFYNYNPFTVIIISFLGIFFWVRISEILEPIIGKSYYVNIIADNTFSIMINHILALDMIRIIFAIISKKTKYCKNFDFKKFYSLNPSYIYLPNNVLQSGIIYYLSCLILPIIMQKVINKIHNRIIKYKNI